MTLAFLVTTEEESWGLLFGIVLWCLFFCLFGFWPFLFYFIFNFTNSNTICVTAGCTWNDYQCSLFGKTKDQIKKFGKAKVKVEW